MHNAQCIMHNKINVIFFIKQIYIADAQVVRPYNIKLTNNCFIGFAVYFHDNYSAQICDFSQV